MIWGWFLKCFLASFWKLFGPSLGVKSPDLDQNSQRTRQELGKNSPRTHQELAIAIGDAKPPATYSKPAKNHRDLAENRRESTRTLREPSENPQYEHRANLSIALRPLRKHLGLRQSPVDFHDFKLPPVRAFRSVGGCGPWGGPSAPF